MPTDSQAICLFTSSNNAATNDLERAALASGAFFGRKCGFPRSGSAGSETKFSFRDVPDTPPFQPGQPKHGRHNWTVKQPQEFRLQPGEPPRRAGGPSAGSRGSGTGGADPHARVSQPGALPTSPAGLSWSRRSGGCSSGKPALPLSLPTCLRFQLRRQASDLSVTHGIQDAIPTATGPG